MWPRRVPVKDQSNDVSMEVNTSLADKFASLSLHEKDETIKKNDTYVSQELIKVGDKPNIKQSKWHKDALNICGHQIKRHPTWYAVSPFKRPPIDVRNEFGQGEPYEKIVNFARSRHLNNKPLMQKNDVNRNFLGRYVRRHMKILHQKEARNIIFCAQRSLMVVDVNEPLQVKTDTKPVYYK